MCLSPGSLAAAEETGRKGRDRSGNLVGICVSVKLGLQGRRLVVGTGQLWGCKTPRAAPQEGCPGGTQTQGFCCCCLSSVSEPSVAPSAPLLREDRCLL